METINYHLQLSFFSKIFGLWNYRISVLWIFWKRETKFIFFEFEPEKKFQKFLEACDTWVIEGVWRGRNDSFSGFLCIHGIAQKK